MGALRWPMGILWWNANQEAKGPYAKIKRAIQRASEGQANLTGKDNFSSTIDPNLMWSKEIRRLRSGED